MTIATNASDTDDSTTGAAAPPRIVASIVDETATPARPLIHLGVLDGVASRAPGEAPGYAVGVARPDRVEWTSIGSLDLTDVPVERVLLAALSALAMRQLRAAQVQIGDAVIAFGVDPWSLLVLQWARLQGASPIAFACFGPEALKEKASLFGPDVLLSDPGAEDLSRALKLIHRERGFDVVLDGIASQRSVSQALAVLRDGGRYLPVGLQPQQHVSINAYTDLHRRDLEIATANCTMENRDYGALLRFSLGLAGRGRLQLEAVVDPTSGWRVLSGESAFDSGLAEKSV